MQLVLWLVALLGFAPVHSDTPGPAPGQAEVLVVEASCLISYEQLELTGARIREIHIDNQNIFDLDDPEENNALFRTMNRLHVVTRSSIIRRQLLFEQGEPFQARLMYESERLLRSTNYLYDARITVASCDEEGVDILVRTQDVWTLKPAVSISRSGGESRYGFDLEEENFLGRGGSVRYARRIDEERTSTEVGYRDLNLRGRWIALDTTLADNSDGHVVALSLARPFYSFDTRWAVGGQIFDRKGEDSVYDLGDEIGDYQENVDYFDFYGGWSGGLSDGWVQRWLAGFVYDNREFERTQDSVDLAVIPEDRRLVYPYLEYQLLEDRFVRAENLDQIYRTEDVFVGTQIQARLGLLTGAMGADRNGAIFSSRARRGYGDPSSVLWEFFARASGRMEEGDFRNTIFGGGFRSYVRQSERRLLFVALDTDIGEALDLDNPIEIGGDSGIRGYPLRYQRGEARARFTIEQRYFTDYYLWRLFRVGGAVFFDAGRVWGEDPFGSRNLGLLRDVGFGLRLSSTRSSIGKMIHLDFAFPLDGDDSIDSFQILLEGRRSF